ncbi:40S ribosomal protein S3a [Tupaia chinensis]|uniref:40S ribosomal protein S3a n=1 Tax=Tupaia chinensis TaxID=246437 RepID=L9JE97_TUPCH|nr:40S ribosomal protein S3a [Tupaia chinensis]
MQQIQKTSYAQYQQVRQIQKKMMEIMTQKMQTNDLKEVVNKLIPDSIGKDIEKACQSIYPLHDVFVKKELDEGMVRPLPHIIGERSALGIGHALFLYSQPPLPNLCAQNVRDSPTLPFKGYKESSCHIGVQSSSQPASVNEMVFSAFLFLSVTLLF